MVNGVYCKPCKFCGGDANKDYTISNLTLYSWIKCTDCNARTDRFQWLDHAIEAWNSGEYKNEDSNC